MELIEIPSRNHLKGKKHEVVVSLLSEVRELKINQVSPTECNTASSN